MKILYTEPKQISSVDKVKLHKQGILVIEVEDLTKIKTNESVAPLNDVDLITQAAMYAIKRHSVSCGDSFSTKLAELILARSTPPE